MDFRNKTVVVTGGSQGIGAALAHAFEAKGASVWVLDQAVEKQPQNRRFLACDVSDFDALAKALGVIRAAGEIDIYVSNAGVMRDQPSHAASASLADWSRCWSVNVMAHVHAAKILLPRMIERQSGYFVIVASAAGLLNQIGDAAYSATKHAAVSFADSLAITHGDDGIGVSVVCPQYVATLLIGLDESDARDSDTLLSADEVANVVLQAVSERRFLVLPHPDVARYAEFRAKDHDAWIEGMRKLRRSAEAGFGRVDPKDFYKLV